jgi:hypothetical protein
MTVHGPWPPLHDVLAFSPTRGRLAGAFALNPNTVRVVNDEVEDGTWLATISEPAL